MPDQSTPSYFLQIHFNFMLPSMLKSFKWLFPSFFPTKIPYAPPLFPTRSTCAAHLILLDLITRIIFGEDYRARSLSLCSLVQYGAFYFISLTRRCNFIGIRIHNWFGGTNSFHFRSKTESFFSPSLLKYSVLTYDRMSDRYHVGWFGIARGVITDSCITGLW